MANLWRGYLAPTRTGRWERLLLLLGALFVSINGVALSLALDGRLSFARLWPLLGWLVTLGAAHRWLERHKPQRDPLLLPIVGLLLGWGLLLVSRLAPNFVVRQFVWVVLGTGLITAVATLRFNLRLLRRYRYTWLLGGILLLAATLIFGVNPIGFGARLWLPVPIPFTEQIYFQPSELLKLLLVVFFASYFADREQLLRLELERRGRLGPIPYLAPLLIMWGFCIMLLVWQRDLGAATLFFFLFIGLLYLATGEKLYVAVGGALLLVAGVIAYLAFDLVALRIEAWINPWPDATDRAFQIVQSLYALAAGGISGSGVGQGFPTYIPVVHSDFAFAAIGEEWGLVGSLATVALFAALVQRGLRIAMRARGPFRRYLATGVVILLGTQALLIMGGVTKLLPLTGVTLPFVSYGGSSMMVSAIMIGILLYLSGDMPRHERQLARIEG